MCNRLLPIVLLLFVGTAQAGKFNKAVTIGDAGPRWTMLVGTDDKPHSLDDLADAKLVVVLFTCNHCPIASGYEERLLALARDYAPRGVRFAAINCNTGEADQLPAMKERAAQKKYPYAYLYDPSQKIGRNYGASVTPQVFILKTDRTIGYMGAIDDSWNDPTAVEHPYLREALDALLAGREPPATETRPRGCPIQYRD